MVSCPPTTISLASSFPHLVTLFNKLHSQGAWLATLPLPHWLNKCDKLYGAFTLCRFERDYDPCIIPSFPCLPHSLSLLLRTHARTRTRTRTHARTHTHTHTHTHR